MQIVPAPTTQEEQPLEPAPSPDPTPTPEPSAPKYVVNSLVFGQEGTNGYLSVLDSLAPQHIDNTQAREFAGAADVWVQGDAVFVTNSEALTITKYSVSGTQLIEQGVVSFAAYGFGSFGFWLNTFVSADKAYVLNDTTEYIIWNPTTMTITGTIELPAPPAQQGFKAFPAYSDRAAVVRDGLLYQPTYYTDDTYFLYTPGSRIVVTDVATDSVVDVLDAPCPGLDYATQDGDGNIYFSSWVYAAGGAAVLDQPDTCVFEVPSSGEPHVAFSFADVTDGRQGAALRYVGNGRALISVLHEERFEVSDDASASDLAFANNWRFWSYDLATGNTTQIDAIDWNGGAQYSFDIDQKTYMLVAASDYTTTKIYDVGDGLAPTPVIDVAGWATRLFEVK